MKNILIGVDFHVETERLIDITLKFAKPFESKIWLLHAFIHDPGFVGFETNPGFIRDLKMQELHDENKMIQGYVESVKKEGFEAAGFLVQGPTVDVMLNESKKLDIDLIVFGHHEHSFLYSLFFGSRASDLIKKTEIPVLVVPFVDE